MNAVLADGILRTLASKMEALSPSTLMKELNNALKNQLEAGMNVTMVIGLINPESKNLTLANAGHHAYPLLLRNGTVQQLVAKGMPLGMMASIPYREVEFQLESGDVLVFMTDGIIEGSDTFGNLYSASGRLEETLKRFRLKQPASAMVDSIIDDTLVFSSSKAHEDDDITVVVVKMK